MIQQNTNSTLMHQCLEIADRIRSIGDKVGKQEGITTQQWVILLHLAGDDNMTYLQNNKQEKPLMAKELAEALHTSRANITNLVNVLIGKSLVLQVADNLDRRRKRLRLSAEGQKVVKRLEKQRNLQNDRLLAGFDEREKLTVSKFIRTFLINFDNPGAAKKATKSVRAKRA
jgi:DNA-binding MarR family transcriptional regulator